MATKKKAQPPPRAKKAASARKPAPPRAKARARPMLNVVTDEGAPVPARAPAPPASKPRGGFLPGMSTARLDRYDALLAGRMLGGVGPQPRSPGLRGIAPTSPRAADTDDRTEVADTSVDPYAWVCDLSLVSPSGETLVATGWLAGPKLVVTAGHCVYNHQPLHGVGWMRREGTTVTAGRNGNFSLATTGVAQLLTTREWLDNAGEQYDLGAMLLTDPIGDELGFFTFAAYRDADLQGMNVNLAGYPIDKPGNTMWQEANRIDLVTPQQLGYLIDTAGGDSGAPLIAASGDRYVVVGIHTCQTVASRFATRIDAAVFNQIKAWQRL